MASPLALKDADWIKTSFLVPKDRLELREQQNRFFSSASLKFVDTKPGGNNCINPPPQFTSNADIKPRAIAAFEPGLGRYYSEAIDDNSQIIYMRFGVPEYNSLTTFFTGFYDSSAGQMARSGRAGGVFFQLGKAVGLVVAMVTWELQVINLLGNIWRFATGSPSSKFYYLKPTMHMYWSSVTTMVNRMAVNRGIVPALYGSGDKTREIQNARLARDLPDIFKPGGGVDVFKIAGRAQILDRRFRAALEAKRIAMADGVLSKLVQEVYRDPDVFKPTAGTHKSYLDYITSWINSSGGSSSGSKLTSETSLEEYNNTQLDANGKQIPSASSGSGVESIHTDSAGFIEQMLGGMDDGMEFAAFRVNATGQMSESFSNSAGESELSQKINGIVSGSRSTNFSFAGGNVTGVIGAALGAVTDTLEGIGSGIGMSGLAALAGSAFVDIPKHWQSHTASLPRANYTINLVSPYGNPISQLINLDLPLAMLLAAALPMATGKQSFTSPFLVELYDQGKCQTRLGLIDSLSITRGVGNLGFNNEKHAMAIDVSFSVLDLSSVIAMPINESFTMAGLEAGLAAGALTGAAVGAINGSKGGVVGVAGGAIFGAVAGAGVGGVVGEVVDLASNTMKSLNNVFSDDTAFNDYMAVLAGMGLADQIYSSNKLKFNLTNVAQQWNSYFSVPNFASFLNGTIPVRLASSFFKGTSRGE